MPKNNKKLVHLMTSLQVGGAERFVLELATEQQQQGINVHIVSLGSERDPLVNVAQKKGIRVRCLQTSGRMKRLWRLYGALADDAVIHLHSPYALLNLLPLLPFLNKRVIYTRHGAGAFNRPLWRWVHRLARPYVHYACFVSEQGKAVFKQHQHWPDTTLKVIENGVPVPNEPPKPVGSTLRLGMVGRMVQLKAYHHLLSAVATLTPEQKTMLEIHLFGDGPCRAALQHKADTELHDTAVIFHGMQSDQHKIYDAFDLLVVCSETEGLSMVIIEAMARGIPVIATNVGGSPRLVLPEKTGWLYEYGDKPTLAAYIVRLLTSQASLDTVRANCIAHIQAHFSIRQSAENYAVLYQLSEN